MNGPTETVRLAMVAARRIYETNIASGTTTSVGTPEVRPLPNRVAAYPVGPGLIHEADS